MAQLSDDCFAFGGPLMTVADALARIAERVVPVADRADIALEHAAGRILAEDVVAEVAVPPHDNSAVDGFAVYHADLSPDAETRLPVRGYVSAGHPLGGPARPGSAVRIFTGAPMPRGDGDIGPDTVMMQEDCTAEGDTVLIRPGIRRGANRRAAGEDVMPGRTVLTAGTRLRPQDIGIAAAIGRRSLPVYAPIRVAIFSSGDEVVEPGESLTAGAIHDANRYALMAALDRLGCTITDLGILPDEGTTVRRALEEAARSHDLLITSGGMSTGDEDHMKAAVDANGALHFWRLAIKPGRPVALGQIRSGGRNVPIAGLPGNPVAVLVTFMILARPLILRLAGAADCRPHRFRVCAGFEVRKKPERREYIRARLRYGDDGRAVAEKAGPSGAGILSSLVAADGLLELPEEVTHVASGDMVDFLPFSELMS